MSSSVISAHDSSPPASWLCSQGHASTEADFCSECGLKIAIAPDSSPDPSPDPTLKPASGAGNPNVSAHTRANTGDQENARDSANRVCPDCGGQHQMDWGSFCEGCGYNFTLGVSSETGLTNGATGLQSMGIELPVAEATGAESAVTESAITEPEPGPVEREATQAEGWAIAITIDPSLWDVAISPAPPELSVEPVLLLVRPEGDRPFLIGRTSQTQAIYPDIALDFDNAVSQRHAILRLQPNQALSLRDLGSSNGTLLNGQGLTPLQDYPLQSGDSLTLGHWTRLTLTLR